MTLRSSWLARSVSCVFGDVNGTVRLATVRFGITSALGVHGPGQSAAYRVVRLNDQLMLPPPVVNAPGMLCSEPLNCRPHGSGSVPASLICVRHGMSLWL